MYDRFRSCKSLKIPVKVSVKSDDIQIPLYIILVKSTHLLGVIVVVSRVMRLRTH